MQGGHAKDLAPALAAELSGDDAVDAGADGVTGLVDENAGVVVETDDAAVGALGLLARAHHDRVPDVPPLHLVRRRRRRRPHPRVAGAPLLLHDRYESVACRLGGGWGCRGVVVSPECVWKVRGGVSLYLSRILRTYSRMPPLPNDEGALDDSSSRVIDAVQHRLIDQYPVSFSDIFFITLPPSRKFADRPRTFNWIMAGYQV